MRLLILLLCTLVSTYSYAASEINTSFDKAADDNDAGDKNADNDT